MPDKDYSKYYNRGITGKHSLKSGFGFVIEWYSLDGRYVKEWFVTPKSTKALMDVSYVHVWNHPELGLREYLKHLPLCNVKISIYEE